jgi:hypothetical protein
MRRAQGQEHSDLRGSCSAVDEPRVGRERRVQPRQERRAQSAVDQGRRVVSGRIAWKGTGFIKGAHLRGRSAGLAPTQEVDQPLGQVGRQVALGAGEPAVESAAAVRADQPLGERPGFDRAHSGFHAGTRPRGILSSEVTMRQALRSLGLRLATARELLGGLWRGPRWWLVPVILVLLPLALLLIFFQAVPLVSPFVYAVF